MSARLVLYYHRVAAAERDAFGLCVTAERFLDHLQVLAATADVTVLDRLLGAVPKRRPAVAVTFDDGYQDNVTVVPPLLEKADVPATVYVTSRLVADGAEFWWDRLQDAVLGSSPGVRWLTVGEDRLWADTRTPGARLRVLHGLHGRLCRLGTDAIDEALSSLADQLPGPSGACTDHLVADGAGIAALAAHPLVEVGAHTVVHPWLSALGPGAQRREIGGSRRDLLAATGTPPRHFAYPFGSPDSYSPTTAALVREAGFRSAVTTVPGRLGPLTDRWQIPRVTVGDWPADQFEAVVRRWVRA